MSGPPLFLPLQSATPCLPLYVKICAMPSRLQRFQKDGYYHAINFSCYRRVAHPQIWVAHSCATPHQRMGGARKLPA